MSEEVATEPVVDDDAALVAEVEELTQSPSEQQADRVKNALIAAKKELRTANRRVKDLEPVAARATEIEERLNAASPIISAVQANPKLMAEALRVVKGETRTSSASTDQPDDDPDAAEFAESLGLYLADGVTPDVARARRGMAVMDKRSGRFMEERIKPIAGSVLGARAEQNVRAALAQTDADGVPLATAESIREAVKQLGPQAASLLANPDVADHVVTVAMGLDRRFNRTPKPVDEPIYLERNGGRRAAESVMDPTLKAALERTGIKEKDAAASINRLQHVGRRGVELGE